MYSIDGYGHLIKTRIPPQERFSKFLDGAVVSVIAINYKMSFSCLAICIIHNNWFLPRISPRRGALPSLRKSNFNYLTEMKPMVFLTHALAAGERGIEREPVKVKLTPVNEKVSRDKYLHEIHS